MKRAWLLWLLVSQTLAADPRTTRIVTEPPAFSIYRRNFDAVKDAYLGESGQPLSLEVSDESTQWKIYFVYHSPGTPPAPPLAKPSMLQTVSLGELTLEGRYPQSGALYPPLTSSQRTDFWWRSADHRKWVFPLLALLALAWKMGRRLRPQGTGARKIGPYLLLDQLGQGAFGEVFRVKKPSDSLEAALKVLHKSALEDPTVHTRFQREVQVCKGLHHPHIVELYDWGEEDGRLYMVMELLRGETLAQRLRRDPWPELGEVASWMTQLASALAALHERGLIHRDVKPDNLFLTTAGIKLMDFGIASGELLTRATATGLALGTPAYMAPEQISGQAQSASDQYAMGILAYLLLARKRPYEGESATAVAHMHLHEPVPSLLKDAPSLPQEVDRVLQRMLAKRPESRFEGVQAAAGALAEALSRPVLAADDPTGPVTL